MIRALAFAFALISFVPMASAQTIGTFRWQLQPFCNVVSFVVTQTGGVYNLDGFDDQCELSTRAPATGIATLTPGGAIVFGFSIVVTPGGTPIHVAAIISIATLGGRWQDNTGASGEFVLTPGARTEGEARGVAETPQAIPNAFLLLHDGGFLALGRGAGSIPASGSGSRMMWYPKKTAFRVGRVDGNQWDDANIGDESVAFNRNTRATASFSAAFGNNTLASGLFSTAMGSSSTASGNASMAVGSSTTASGINSTAMGSSSIASGGSSIAVGSSTTASGPDSTAMGSSSTASGGASMAMGSSTTASGSNSTAMGAFTTASGHNSIAIGSSSAASGDTAVAIGTSLFATGDKTVVLGSSARALVDGAFIFGDASTSAIAFAPAANTFTVRAAGGTRFYSNAALTAGVVLASGAGAFASVSDVNMKEHFRDLDGNDVLAKLARMPIREWNYKAQDSTIRHVGPTAQDFTAAFGLGEDPLRISTIDADGIALRAIQALEARTRELIQENAELRARLTRLETKHP